jgi:g-D-glutamyl-meso-diaminopimelate peptidase
MFTVPADESGRKAIVGYIEKKYGMTDVQAIAKSILSRPIEVWSIGEGKRCIAVFAAHHALESITSNIAYLLIDTLLGFSRSDIIRGIYCKLLLSKYRFMIVPCVNPDGVEMRFHGVGKSPIRERQIRMSSGDFSLWQANARGVDLNHNYDFRFSEYKALEHEFGIVAGRTLFSGEYPESEPETRGVANFVRALAPVAVISLHSQGEEIYGYPNTRKVGRYLERLGKLTGYKVSVPTGTAAYGGLCDYTASLGIPSFTYEVGRGENPLNESTTFSIFERIAESIVLLPTLL